MTHEQLNDPYTYFETSSGLLAYSYGYLARLNAHNLVSGVVGYFSPNPTERIQLKTGKHVEKVMWHGFEGNWKFEEHFKNLSLQLINEFKRLTVSDAQTGEGMVVVPENEVAKVYSPTQALVEALQDNRSVVQLVELLARFNIYLEDMGLYGSMQTGLVKNSQSTDIDLILYGLDKYEILLEVIKYLNVQTAGESKYQSINEIEYWRRAKIRRNQTSKIFLSENIQVDVKIVRKPTDPIAFDFGIPRSTDKVFSFSGRVVEASHALSIPTVFKVETKNDIYTVATRKYVFLGAAAKGDMVEVSGLKIRGENTVLIADPKQHYIYRSS